MFVLLSRTQQLCVSLFKFLYKKKEIIRQFLFQQWSNFEQCCDGHR